MSDIRQAALESGDPIEVDFLARIRLFPEDVAEAGHDIAQAIQNQIGASGAKVVEIDV